MITTNRLFLRPYQASDANDLYTLVNKNKEHLGGNFPITLELCSSVNKCSLFIQEQTDYLTNKTKIAYGIFDLITTTYIGHIFLKGIEWRVPKGEIGYFIDKDWQGKGLITEALTAFSMHCFDDWKLEKLFLRTTINNIASQRVALKVGFEQEGLLRKDFRTTNGQLVDVYYYGKIKNHSPSTEL